MDSNQREADPSRLSKTARADRRWTLLFLGNRGKTITFHHFKAVVIVSALILVSSIGVSGGFWWLYRGVRAENSGLQEEIENMKQAIASVRDEKDILTARLVVAESRVAEVMEKNAPEPKAAAGQISSAKEADKQPASLSVAEKPESPINVDVQNFIVFFEPEINTLRVEYKLLNTGRKGNPVSGRTLVIMKEDEKKSDDWLVMPAVPLIDSRPQGNRGKYFSINRFRTVRFKANDQIGPHQYKYATVFVFSSKGTLLLEKEFPVGLQSKTLSITERAAPVRRSQPSKPKPSASGGQASASPPIRPAAPTDQPAASPQSPDSAPAAAPGAPSGSDSPAEQTTSPPESQINLP